MSSMSGLPTLVNYQEPLVVLPPETQNFEYTAVPVNGATFAPSSQILVDLGNRGFLDPASIYFRYKITYTFAAGADANTINIVGTPAYTPFLRLDTFANSQNIETINNYNTVANMYMNLSLTTADKLGQQYNLGYNDSTLANENTDGSIISLLAAATSTSQSYSAPLIGLLGWSEKLIPLFLLNNIRIALTLDSAANICSNVVGATVRPITTFSISNFEICYNMIDMGMEVQNEIIRMNPKLRIKTSSIATSIAPNIASGTTGSTSLVFNLRYASVKAMIAIFGGNAAAKSANKLMDSFDITSNNGDFQFNIGGVNYPQKSLSTLNNKAGIMMELRRAMGSILNNNVSLSVNVNEFNITDSSANPTTVVLPGKFWVAQNLQKLTVNQKAFFTGVSTQLAPINLNINIGTATTQAYTPLLVLLYDAIIEIDPATKQIIMIQ